MRIHVSHILRLFFIFFITGYHVQAQVDSIVIGHGGGFTGQTKTVKILTKELLKGNGMDAIRYGEKAVLKKKDRHYFFQQANKLWEEGQTFDHPYNSYSFLELHAKGKTIRMTWGQPSFAPPSHVLSLYQCIQDFSNKQKFQSR